MSMKAFSWEIYVNKTVKTLKSHHFLISKQAIHTDNKFAVFSSECIGKKLKA